MAVNAETNGPTALQVRALRDMIGHVERQAEGLMSIAREVQRALDALDSALLPVAVPAPITEAERSARSYTYKTRMEVICGAH